jgi:hypothetical protein
MTRTIRTPTPLTPSPLRESLDSLGVTLRGDGGGFATPIPLGTGSPLSATRPKLQASPTAERGARGVRLGIHSLKMTHSHPEG